MVNHLSRRVTRTGVTHVDVFDGDEEGADNLTCAFCSTSLGYSSGDGEIPSSWRDYWAVGQAGDEGATVFCEDDISWLYDVADALRRDLAPVFAMGAAALTQTLTADNRGDHHMSQPDPDPARCASIAPQDGLLYRRRCTLPAAASEHPDGMHQWLRRGHAIRWPDSAAQQ